MADVCLFVHGEIRKRARVGDSVEFSKAGNFLGSDLRDLRFVHVKCGDGLSECSLRRNFVVAIEQRGDAGEWLGALHRYIAHAKRRRKLAPELRMRGSFIQFFREIFLDQRFQLRIAIGAARQVLQIFGERLHVLVILLGIKRQSLLRQLPFRPRAVKRVFQQMIFFHERVERAEQRLAFVTNLRHPILLNFPASLPQNKTNASYRISD